MSPPLCLYYITLVLIYYITEMKNGRCPEGVFPLSNVPFTNVNLCFVAPTHLHDGVVHLLSDQLVLQFPESIVHEFCIMP